MLLQSRETRAVELRETWLLPRHCTSRGGVRWMTGFGKEVACHAHAAWGYLARDRQRLIDAVILDAVC